MIRSAFNVTLQILFGFLPLGIAFGLLFQELGYALVKAGDTTAGDLGDMSTLDDQTLGILLKDFQERVADLEQGAE